MCRVFRASRGSQPSKLPRSPSHRSRRRNDRKGTGCGLIGLETRRDEHAGIESTGARDESEAFLGLAPPRLARSTDS